MINLPQNTNNRLKLQESLPDSSEKIALFTLKISNTDQI